jgi:hypothetical protein
MKKKRTMATLICNLIMTTAEEYIWYALTSEKRMKKIPKRYINARTVLSPMNLLGFAVAQLAVRKMGK